MRGWTYGSAWAHLLNSNQPDLKQHNCASIFVKFRNLIWSSSHAFMLHIVHLEMYNRQRNTVPLNPPLLSCYLLSPGAKSVDPNLRAAINRDGQDWKYAGWSTLVSSLGCSCARACPRVPFLAYLNAFLQHLSHSDLALRQFFSNPEHTPWPQPFKFAFCTFCRRNTDIKFTFL